MNLIHPRVAQHLDSLVPERPPELLAMERYAEENQFPIIGPAAGHYCYLTARMIGARRIFELGSGYGYSTAWFARALRENLAGLADSTNAADKRPGDATADAVVHHTVWDEELSRMAREHLDALGYGDLVEYRVSEAVQALRETDGPFDLVFNDIEKGAYPDSLQVIERKLRAGGVLIVDNLLWHGRIFDEDDTSDATEGIRELTRRVTRSQAWTVSIVPIRDGLLVAVRTGS